MTHLSHPKFLWEGVVIDKKNPTRVASEESDGSLGSTVICPLPLRNSAFSSLGAQGTAQWMRIHCSIFKSRTWGDLVRLLPLGEPQILRKQKFIT